MTKLTEKQKDELIKQLIGKVDKNLLSGAETVYKNEDNDLPAPPEYILNDVINKRVASEPTSLPPEYVEDCNKESLKYVKELDSTNFVTSEKELELPKPPIHKPKPKPDDSDLTIKPLKKFIDKIKDLFAPSFTYLIEMNHYNGTISHFIASVKRGTFKHNEGSYIIDESVKIYCNSTKLYMLRYHEGFATPIEFSVDVQELKGMLPEEMTRQDSDYKIDTSFNPWVLFDVLKGEYTKGVLAGAEVSVLIKRIFLICMIVLGAVIIHLGLNAYKSGWI